MSIQWIEINPASPMASIAGRNDDVPGSTGDAAGAVVSFLSNAATTIGINLRIREALAGSRSQAQRMLPNTSPNGVLVVAEIEVARYGEMETQRLNWCRLTGPTFRTPRQAVNWYEHQPTISATNNRGRITNRFFWGTCRY